MITVSLTRSCQSAYCPGHSTKTALLKIQSDLDLELDWGQGAGLVLLDESATLIPVTIAFCWRDWKATVGRITGSALESVMSYLTDHTQSVVIDGMLSASTTKLWSPTRIHTWPISLHHLHVGHVHPA